MPLTPMKKGREVLSQLPNGVDTSRPPLKPIAVKDQQQPPSIPKHAATPPPRSSLLAANKRTRPSPHLKRVSFGGDTINIIKQHMSEFSTPPSDDAHSPTPSPPQKKVRGSFSSPPPPGRSPIFARVNPDLGEEDDTITVPDAEKLTRDASPMRRQSTRGSFGMFLDTDIGRGVGEDEEDHTLSLAHREVLDVESPTGSEGDVTQNIAGIVERADEDEAMGGDEVEPQVLSQVEGPAEKRRRSSIRKSLPYLAEVQEAEGENETRRNKDRWSMVPINEENADFGSRGPLDDESPSDATLHVHDLLSHLDDDRTESFQPTSNNSGVSVREKLPDNRQLFDSQEDPTIHFHDEVEQQLQQQSELPSPQPLRDSQPDDRATEERTARRDTPVKSILKNPAPRPSEPALVSSQSTATPLSTSKHDTPASLSGSILRLARERTPSNRQRQVESQLRELSDSVLKKSRPAEAPVATKKKGFGVKEFLAAAKVHFDDGIAVDTRKPSLAPGQHNITDVDTQGAEWQVLESVKKQTILGRLQEEVSKYMEKTQQAVQSIERVEEELERVRPAVFAKLEGVEKLAAGEVTNLQCSLKRLQKVVMREVRLDWVKSRQIWEGEMGAELDQIVKEMRGDLSSAREGWGVLRDARESLKSVGGEEIEEVQGGQVEEMRKEVVSEWEEARKLDEKVTENRGKIEHAEEERRELRRKKDTLETEHGKLETFGGEKADDNMRKVLAERKELNAIVQRVSGVRAYLLSSKQIGVELGELMDVMVDIDGEHVSNVSIKTVKAGEQERFVQDGVQLIGAQLKKVQHVRDLPCMLASCASHLSHLRQLIHQANTYFQTHLGHIESVTVHQDNPIPSISLSLVLPLYSLRLHSKLDVNLTLSLQLPPHDEVSYRVSQFCTTRYINNLPTDETLRQTFTSQGFKAPGTFNLLKALTSLWSHL